MATEKELDLALKAALESDQTFLEWFISQTKFSGCGAKLVSCRADSPWGSHPFQSTDPATGESTITTRQSETDVLLVVANREGELLGIHIENKVGAGKFTNLQPEMYAQRAAHWLEKPHYGGYVDFETVLVAPDAFRQRNAVQAEHFGCFISHEAVGHHISLFRQDTGAA